MIEGHLRVRLRLDEPLEPRPGIILLEHDVVGFGGGLEEVRDQRRVLRLVLLAVDKAHERRNGIDAKLLHHVFDGDDRAIARPFKAGNECPEVENRIDAAALDFFGKKRRRPERGLGD